MRPRNFLGADLDCLQAAHGLKVFLKIGFKVNRHSRMLLYKFVNDFTLSAL